MHKYWGKKPSKNLFHLIERYTQMHDVVLDPFAGYGVFVCEAYLLGRNAIGNDLNPAATFIQEQLLNGDVDLQEFEVELKRIRLALDQVEEFWYSIQCPLCGKSAKTIATLRRKDNFPIRNKIRCSCSKTVIEYDLAVSDSDSLISTEDKHSNIFVPSSPLMRNGRISALDGMTTNDLFTIRSLACHFALFNSINETINEDIKKLLQFSFTSNLANCSKLVPPIKSRGPMNPGAWMTGFYVGETYIENNVFHYFENRASKIISGKKDYYKQKGRLGRPLDLGKINNISDFSSTSVGYLIESQDAKKLKYPDNSIDYIFTDPPYGDSVPYFEQSIIWNTWLNHKVDYLNEIVISDSKVREKDSSSFELDISKCISEIWRVLKVNKHFTVTFHSISGDEWYALLHGCLVNGFVLDEIEWLTQKTFAPRQLNRKMTVKGDLLITLRKIETKPSLKYLTESETIELIKSKTKSLLKNTNKNTNDVYINLISYFFSNHCVFTKINFIDVLLDNFNLDENGYWSI